MSQAQELHPRCGMDAKSAPEFSEICNSKAIFVTNYKVAFNILTVISHDSVVLTLIAENWKKKKYFQNVFCKHRRKNPRFSLN